MKFQRRHLEEGEIESDKDNMMVEMNGNKENMSNDRFSPKKRSFTKFEKLSGFTENVFENHENGNKLLKKTQTSYKHNRTQVNNTPSKTIDGKDVKQNFMFGRSSSIDDLNSFFPDWVDPGGELTQNPYAELTEEIRRKKKEVKLQKQRENEVLKKITTKEIEDETAVNTTKLKKGQALYCGDGWIREKNGDLRVCVSWKYLNLPKPIDPRLTPSTI